jgi:transposase
MDSNNDNQASSAEFLTFLRIHPVGVLARAARRRRIRGGFDPKLEAGAAEAVAKEERRKALEKEKSLKLQAENALKKKEMIAKRAREQELELLNGSPTTRKSAHQVNVNICNVFPFFRSFLI